MALFGTVTDANTLLGIAEEFVANVVTQQIGYYKTVLPNTQPNVYGEALVKSYIGPVLINCLIDRGNFNTATSDFGPDTIRDVTFRFLRIDLERANVVPEVGDVVMYNESYYLVDNTDQNQYFVGKNPDYAYSQGLQNFGQSWSILLSTHYTTPEALGITIQRL